MIEVNVNGEPVRLPEGATVVTLLEKLCVAADRVAVERNRAIVIRAAWADVALAAGDVLEVVQFVGGG